MSELSWIELKSAGVWELLVGVGGNRHIPSPHWNLSLRAPKDLLYARLYAEPWDYHSLEEGLHGVAGQLQMLRTQWWIWLRGETIFGSNGEPECLSLLRLPEQNGLGSLNNQNLFSNSSGGWKSKIKVPAGLVSGVWSLLGLQVAVFLASHCVVIWPFLCAFVEKRERIFSYKTINPIMRTPPAWPNLILIGSQRSHLQIPPQWGLELQYMNFRWKQTFNWSFVLHIQGWRCFVGIHTETSSSLVQENRAQWREREWERDFNFK